jgi:hypothetical protein
LLPTRDFVPVTLQSRWHPLTRNWPVFSLRDYSVAAKSACILIQRDDAKHRELG